MNDIFHRIQNLFHKLPNLRIFSSHHQINTISSGNGINHRNHTQIKRIIPRTDNQTHPERSVSDLSFIGKSQQIKRSILRPCKFYSVINEEIQLLHHSCILCHKSFVFTFSDIFLQSQDYLFPMIFHRIS